MGIQMPGGQRLHASLWEIECGLFHVAYSAGQVAHRKHLMPPYQVGTSASEARRRVEEKARECGFEAIVWEDMPMVSRSEVAGAVETADL